MDVLDCSRFSETFTFFSFGETEIFKFITESKSMKVKCL